LDRPSLNDGLIYIKNWKFSVWSEFTTKACWTGAEDWLWKLVIGSLPGSMNASNVHPRDWIFQKFVRGLSDVRWRFVES
jgi:hypothetical protein